MVAEIRRMALGSWAIKKQALTRQSQMGLDMAVLVVAFALSYILRFDLPVPPQEIDHALTQLPWVVLIQFTILILAGVYTFMWRYIGLAEAKVFFTAACWSAVPILLLRLLLPREFQSWKV